VEKRSLRYHVAKIVELNQIIDNYKWLHNKKRIHKEENSKLFDELSA